MYISPKIKDAFLQGEGDVCFKNDIGFCFMSRHQESLVERMAAQGFSFVSHEEVMKVDCEQNPKPAFIEIAPEMKNNKKIQSFVCRADSVVEFWEMEMPDGINQSL